MTLVDFSTLHTQVHPNHWISGDEDFVSGITITKLLGNLEISAIKVRHLIDLNLCSDITELWECMQYPWPGKDTNLAQIFALAGVMCSITSHHLAALNMRVSTNCSPTPWSLREGRDALPRTRRQVNKIN